MDELIDAVLGRTKNKPRDDGLLGDLLGTVGRWVRTCGCLVVVAIIVAAAAVLSGTIKLTNDQITIIIIFITMIVAVVSLIRTSMGY